MIVLPSLLGLALRDLKCYLPRDDSKDAESRPIPLWELIFGAKSLLIARVELVQEAFKIGNQLPVAGDGLK